MAKTKQSQEYDSTSIQVLHGLEAVRKRPGMYIGSTDARGLHHLVYEIVDNAVDEAIAGYGDQINVTIHADDSITVTDHGRGMPVGMHASGKPTPEVILTVLHAGGKFGQGGYKTSGGLHGVGSSVVNALSESLTVKIVRDHQLYQEDFKNGGTPVGTLRKLGKTTQPTGTTITFKPDPNMFTTTVYNFETLATRLRESAFLLKNVQIVLTDERVGQEQTAIFKYDDGIKDFVKYLNEARQPLVMCFILMVTKTALKSKLRHSITTVIQNQCCHLLTMSELKTEELMKPVFAVDGRKLLMSTHEKSIY